MRSAQQPAANAAMQTCAPRTKSARRNRSAQYFISLFRSYRYWCRCIIAPFFTIPGSSGRSPGKIRAMEGYLPHPQYETPPARHFKNRRRGPLPTPHTREGELPPFPCAGSGGYSPEITDRNQFPDNPGKEKKGGVATPPLMGGGSMAPVPARKKGRGGYPSAVHCPDLIAGMTIL
jgi:hypothetical protein